MKATFRYYISKINIFRMEDIQDNDKTKLRYILWVYHVVPKYRILILNQFNVTLGLE